MLHLRRGGPDNKEFFMNAVADNIFGKDKITWVTPGTFRRRAGAFTAAFSGAKAFGKKNSFDGQFYDHTAKGEPVLKMVKREGDRFIVITRK